MSESVRILLKSTYKCDSDQDVRISAGKALGYSRPRMWMHEHPIETVAVGVASASGLIGLGIMLYNYLNR